MSDGEDVVLGVLVTAAMIFVGVMVGVIIAGEVEESYIPMCGPGLNGTTATWTTGFIREGDDLALRLWSLGWSNVTVDDGTFKDVVTAECVA